MTGIPKMATGFGLWKIGAIGMALLTVVLVGFLVKTQMEKSSIEKQRQELVQRIEDPVTGYVARLNTAQNNVVILKTAVAKQNSEFQRQSEAAKTELARLKQQLVTVQREKVEYERRARELMARPIQGNTPIERFNDVDAQIMKDLQK